MFMKNFISKIKYKKLVVFSIIFIPFLGSVLGAVAVFFIKKFDIKIFITGFFGNAILSILLTYLGNKLNVDIYLAAVFVFVGRMFTNLAIIRRYYVEKISEKVEALKLKKQK